ncbi:hypothetical protein TeGR_g10880 [Tetraparma gracilis]|uniref:Tryptophan synthase beta chain-like PALP domain-containing protein n=1 Tax=Tetraparma gracilis TaxID=2962635 RepID=A0ABQ6M650_9STRA|nr:hypothetical protein TeGR_g10880 [Tetraparma gracilis]
MDAIGNTPLVPLHNLSQHLSLPGTVYAKLDSLSVGGSKKDRIARQIVLDALADESLRPGQPVVELTSGNTGTGLAICCAALRFPFTAVMSTGNTPERARMMRALGAAVVLVEQCPGSVPGQVSGADLEKVEERTRQIVGETGAFRADQFGRAGSYRAHYLSTGPEAWAQSSQKIDSFVDFVGSGGTFVGVAKYLKEQQKSTQCFVVEPEAAAVMAAEWSGGEATGDGAHKVQGGGYSKTFTDLPLFDQNISGVDPRSLVDGFYTVSDEEATETARLIARTEGIFGGFSGGANVAAAVKVIREGKGEHVLALICDNGLKYLSTDLYDV